jgi:Mn2+/Fe2+ NRAMP family transporter
MPGGMPNPPSPLHALLKAIGPGILFAGAAIGVSHLVQSTRAGAEFGLSMISLVILAHAMKLPAMLFGPRYAAATGTSLLHAYRLQGRHALVATAVITVGTSFTILAAVTLVTAAIVKIVLVDPIAGADAPLWAVSLGILTFCAAMIAAGGFAWLDGLLKALMVLMACSTLFAAALEAPALDFTRLPLLPAFPDEPAARLALIAFAVALVGWMPAPLDISIWHSLWTLARRRQTGHAPTRRQCDTDFAIGYALCVLLAICFVVLGAGELFLKGVQPAAGGGPFAAQLIDLYTASIGPWVRPVIAACAVAVMFSTTLTVLDALPRTTVHLIDRFRGPESAHQDQPETCRRPLYWALLVGLVAGAMLLIARVQGEGFRALVDLATTLSFLGTPVFAFFNHRAMHAREVPEELRPGRALAAWSWAGIAFWAAFAALFLWQQFIASPAR